MRLTYEILIEYLTVNKYLGAVSTYNDKLKLEAKLSILGHALEKGLSLPNPKNGFGEKKVVEIFRLLDIYEREYNDMDFIKSLVEILHAYFQFNIRCGHVNESLFKKFKTDYSKIIIEGDTGVELIKKNEIETFSKINFDSFSKSRHSVRDFSGLPVDINIVLQAIEISRKTPSSCNRQPWRVYVIKDAEKRKSIFEWQLGTRGFSESIGVIIVITCSLKYYFLGETHQGYIDGGLYSMTVIYALHSLGLGAIPLTLGLPSNKLRYLYRELDIKKDEMPIMMIGVGVLKENFVVARSVRKEITEYTKIM